MLYIEANLAKRTARPVSEGRDRIGYLIAAPASRLVRRGTSEKRDGEFRELARKMEACTDAIKLLDVENKQQINKKPDSKLHVTFLFPPHPIRLASLVLSLGFRFRLLYLLLENLTM